MPKLVRILLKYLADRYPGHRLFAQTSGQGTEDTRGEEKGIEGLTLATCLLHIRCFAYRRFVSLTKST